MLVNQQSLTDIYKSFSVIFAEAFQRAKPKWEQLATEVPSTTRENAYKWLGKIPKMREWIGQRVIQNLTAHDYTIKNKSWELTIGVDRDDIEDDTIGVYRPLMVEMAEVAKIHPDDLIFDLIKNGITNLCYDLKAFFATDHPMAGGTKSNRLSGANTALAGTGFGLAKAGLLEMTDDEGEPLDVGEKFLLVVPPALEEAGRELLNADRIGSGKTNVWKNAADLLVAPKLAGEDKVWYLFAVGKALKPFIYQNRRAPNFVAKDKPTDDNVFENKEFRYGVDSRDNAGYGLWQLAMRMKGEA